MSSWFWWRLGLKGTLHFRYTNIFSVSDSLLLKPEQWTNSNVHLLFRCVLADQQFRIHLYSNLKHCSSVFGNVGVSILVCFFTFLNTLSHYQATDCSVTLVLCLQFVTVIDMTFLWAECREISSNTYALHTTYNDWKMIRHLYYNTQTETVLSHIANMEERKTKCLLGSERVDS